LGDIAFKTSIFSAFIENKKEVGFNMSCKSPAISPKSFKIF
jgi:hypothetical protein